jgi:hypothetical protein
MKNSRFLIAAAAVLGLGAGQMASQATHRPAEQRQIAAIKNGMSTREIKEDQFGGYTGGMLNALMRDNGCPPKDWGMSRQCSRMVRKNRLHRMGLSHAKI